MVASGWEHLRKDLADAKILEAKLCKTDPPRD
jgi:hypothetical protein